MNYYQYRDEYYDYDYDGDNGGYDGDDDEDYGDDDSCYNYHYKYNDYDYDGDDGGDGADYDKDVSWAPAVLESRIIVINIMIMIMMRMIVMMMTMIRGHLLAFTRYCLYQYCMACIETKDGRGGGDTVLRNRVGDEEEEWGAQTKGVFANNSIDSCTKASN